MQEVLGLMLGLSDPETRRLVAERLGSIEKMEPADEAQTITVAAAKQVIKGISEGLAYGAKHASPVPRPS